jgi:hypothetical protein
MYVPNSSPNRSSRRGCHVEGGIIHGTAGGDALGTVNWLCNPAAKASTHDVISRSGRLFELVRPEDAAWHAGSNKTVPVMNDRQGGLNLFTFGIELCNWGVLYRPNKDEDVLWDTGKRDRNGKVFEKRVRRAGRFYTWMKNWSYEYKGNDPVEMKWTNVVGRYVDCPPDDKF